MPIVIINGILSLPSAVVAKTVQANYTDDISSDTTFDFVVPEGKLWFVYGGWTERMGTCVFQIRIFDADDQEIMHSPQSDNGSTELDWGIFQDKDHLLDNFQVPFPLSAGMYVRYFYYANPYNTSVSLIVLEEDV